MNGNDTYLDVNNSHLRVTSGNVYATAFNLDQISIVASANTVSTVNFNNDTKAFNAVSNIEVGTANLFVDTTTSRVGIGTDAPAYTLDVHGSANVGVITTTDINVTGNLAVLGTSTIVDTDNLRVKDPIIELGKDNTASPIVDLGLILTRPTGSSNVAIIFDESTDKLEIGYTQGNASQASIAVETAAANPISVNVNGTISGNGSGLTALNATNIASGTLDAARIPTLNQNTTGSAGSATTAGTCSGNSATATTAATLTTAQTIGGVNFDGSAAIVPTTFNGATFNGDVGIGTTSPATKLHLIGVGTGSGPRLRFETLNNGNGNYTVSGTEIGGIQFGADDYGWTTQHVSSEIVGIHDTPNYSGAMGILAFKTSTTQGSNPTEKMRILANGNVGIGTSSPTAQLHISSGTSGDCVLKIEADTDNNNEYDNPRIEFISDNGYNTALIGAGQMPFETLNDNALVLAGYQMKFYTGVQDFTDSVNMTECIRIDVNGNVGIGTTSPGCILDVALQHGEISLPMVHFRANPDGASQGDGSVLKLENSGNRTDVELLECVSSGNTRFVVKAGGNVGIGFNDPGTLGLHTYTAPTGRSILHLMGWMYYGDLSGDNETWVTGIGTSTSGDANHFLWRFSLNGAALYNVAFIKYNVVLGDIISFTGQHRAARIENIPPNDAHIYEGLIVVADKNLYESVNGEKRRGKEAITANESVPFLSLCKKAHDKRCFGVISASEDPDKREQKFGNFVSIHPKEDGDTFIFVNSLGEGGMWVTNVNGALESGDYITTSDVPGYGMKQNDDILHNYTVAKITMDCDFNPPTQPVQRVKKKLGEVKYWVETKYIDVTREEYDTLDETERTIEYINSNPIYKKIVKEDSLEEDDKHTELDVRMEMVNDVDAHSQMIWENTDETEKAYKIRHLDASGVITDEASAVHTAAFVGCTYHCG